MKIAVFVKQTPQVASVQVTDKANWPDGDLIINPFDEYAIEEALRIKEKIGCKTAAITYGKAGAESALRDALALGIEEAYHIVDEQYEYLNPQQAAMVLAKAVIKIGDIQMILTGKQATDDDSAMVAPAAAAYLDWPQVGFVRKFESVDAEKAICQRTSETGYDRIEAKFPAVFSVVKEINEPRLPSLKGKMQAKKAPIQKLTLSELGISGESLIKLKSISSMPPRTAGEILTGDTDEIIEKLVGKLKEQQLL
jgi:electron transfer flavoprotein beta subunit